MPSPRLCTSTNVPSKSKIFPMRSFKMSDEIDPSVTLVADIAVDLLKSEQWNATDYVVHVLRTVLVKWYDVETRLDNSKETVFSTPSGCVFRVESLGKHVIVYTNNAKVACSHQIGLPLRHTSESFASLAELLNEKILPTMFPGVYVSPGLRRVKQLVSTLAPSLCSSSELACLSLHAILYMEGLVASHLHNSATVSPMLPRSYEIPPLHTFRIEYFHKSQLHSSSPDHYLVQIVSLAGNLLITAQNPHHDSCISLTIPRIIVEQGLSEQLVSILKNRIALRLVRSGGDSLISSGVSKFKSLSDDVILCILGFLSPHEVIQVSLVHSHFLPKCSEPILWKSLCATQFGSSSLNPLDKHWKNEFIALFLKQKAYSRRNCWIPVSRRGFNVSRAL